MPLQLPRFSDKFAVHLAICGTVLGSEFGPDYQWPSGTNSKQADFQIGEGAESGFALLATEKTDGDDGKELHLHFHFARRSFFGGDAPSSDTSLADFQRATDEFIDKHGNMRLSCRFVIPVGQLPKTSVVYPLLEFESESNGRTLKLSGSQFDISRPPSARMSWFFRETDRSVVTDILADLTGPLRADIAQTAYADLLEIFDSFIVPGRRTSVPTVPTSSTEAPRK